MALPLHHGSLTLKLLQSLHVQIYVLIGMFKGKHLFIQMVFGMQL